MAKYKQAVIPEVSTEEWVKLTSLELRNKAFEAYRTRFFGKKVVNLALGISIGFEREGARKTSHSAPVYSKKACLISVLDQLLRHAEYSNWGDRKPSDPTYVIGFLNFKAKVRIDGRLEHVRIAVRVRNDGQFRCAFHYSMEVNRKGETLTQRKNR